MRVADFSVVPVGKVIWGKKCDKRHFLIEIHSMQGWTATMRHGVTRKRSTQRL